MNDRFKFRFFNTKANKYMPDQYVDETTVFLLARLGGDKYIIEQCTGLKDASGKFIYEGDIVFHRAKNVEIGKITWDKGGFWVVCDTWVIPWNFFTPSRWEIVGNIHENPELLEDK